MKSLWRVLLDSETKCGAKMGIFERWDQDPLRPGSVTCDDATAARLIFTPKLDFLLLSFFLSQADTRENQEIGRRLDRQ